MNLKNDPLSWRNSFNLYWCLCSFKYYWCSSWLFIINTYFIKKVFKIAYKCFQFLYLLIISVENIEQFFIIFFAIFFIKLAITKAFDILFLLTQYRMFVESGFYYSSTWCHCRQSLIFFQIYHQINLYLYFKMLNYNIRYISCFRMILRCFWIIID